MAAAAARDRDPSAAGQPLPVPRGGEVRAQVREQASPTPPIRSPPAGASLRLAPSAESLEGQRGQRGRCSPSRAAGTKMLPHSGWQVVPGEAAPAFLRLLLRGPLRGREHRLRPLVLRNGLSAPSPKRPRGNNSPWGAPHPPPPVKTPKVLARRGQRRGRAEVAGGGEAQPGREQPQPAAPPEWDAGPGDHGGRGPEPGWWLWWHRPLPPTAAQNSALPLWRAGRAIETGRSCPSHKAKEPLQCRHNQLALHL